MEGHKHELEFPSIFIIGAQCTGKTTLVTAISDSIQQEYPNQRFTVIKELARGALESANVNRDDIINGSEKEMGIVFCIFTLRFPTKKKKKIRLMEKRMRYKERN